MLPPAKQTTKTKGMSNTTTTTTTTSTPTTHTDPVLLLFLLALPPRTSPPPLLLPSPSNFSPSPLPSLLPILNDFVGLHPLHHAYSTIPHRGSRPLFLLHAMLRPPQSSGHPNVAGTTITRATPVDRKTQPPQHNI
ncbi:hypothetical protein NEUTE1DRAFT_135764 [Neurospora tetrasperma FGSC 2508]|uniref:Uncharacterized protein n=1 Tax=Neurospora tetrasperma (strain FGSC 2508 / ATCC MYA-4615 / P0657) TaxID=510951 RepID=F8MGP1_NEUT8|nr:uncharacterized protein NEUTE1DRAFT_135764 [Neurospora tetrasperma FGSC 2508]EGO58663.1 hypothetical protein NEUTE1DRAFT_135764 [Neurospora tetrasperma FGSC 2508]EGZ72748.1 hypothetical protein NEUTE2DRAFT_164953 [Neurospora tetrasperma FGSC 2509]